MSTDPYFQFVDDPAAYRNSAALVVRVPIAARGKEKLLGVLAGSLRFPKYFGWNWDALEECLRDLSWLKEVNQVVIVHEGVPFSPRESQLRTYLEILADAMALRRAKPDDLQITVVFPTSAQALVGG
ncbi:MAG: hypothetical protein C0483_05710 [Pirellula sp.]|nr:hypothetical protein [Pirellula sp.]